MPFGSQGMGHLRDLAAFCGQEQEMLQRGNDLPTQTQSSSSICTLVDILRVGSQVVSGEVLMSNQISAVTALLIPLITAVKEVHTAISTSDSDVTKEVHLKHQEGDNLLHSSRGGIEEEQLMSYVSPSGATVDRVSALQLLTQVSNRIHLYHLNCHLSYNEEFR